MARMYPEHLPAEVRRSKGRRSEVKIYEGLRDQLGDDYRVFYSVTWTAKVNGKVRDGETDFIIAHPKGLLVVEVKGGQVGRNGKSGRWTSTDGRGITHDISDPIEQARTAKYLLRDGLLEKRELRGQQPLIGHAVFLPGSGAPTSGDAFGMPLDIFLFSTHLRSMEERVTAILAYWRSSKPGKPLNSATLDLLVDLLAPTFELKLPLAAEMSDADNAIHQLTETQFSLLDRMTRMRKAEIVGGAGTGKTVLLVEKATRLARNDVKTLVLCYNELLSKELNARFAGAKKNLRALTFHQLCRTFAEGAGIDKLPTYDDRDYDEYPNNLLAALDKLDERWRFDALLVDEAQDFDEDWWTPLLLVLANLDDAIVYLFRDDNQRLYARRARPIGDLDDLPEIPLTDNLRNCREIFSLASRYYEGEQKLVSKGPPSPFKPRLITAAGDRAIEKAVAGVLHDLLRGDPPSGLEPSDIVILTGRGREKAILGRTGVIGTHRCSSDPQSGGNEVLLETVFRFKGLERPVVILTELDELHPEYREHALYVGLTRARLGLAVVASEQVIQELSSAAGPVT